MIEVSHITKIYKVEKKDRKKDKKAEKVAVRDLSFTANNGEIFCLLGPNGAGKTTTLRCIATLLRQTEGSITVEGFDTVKDADDVRRNIAFLTNEIKLDDFFTPDYLFGYFGKLRGIEKSVLAERKKELFSYLGINEFADKRIKELSTGMKQKTAIAVSLVHDPKVVIFDEPTNGLDIITARLVTDYLKKLRDDGKVVIVSTHIMSEAERLGDRVAFIINGGCAFCGEFSEIYEQTGTDNLEDAFFAMYKEITEDTENADD